MRKLTDQVRRELEYVREGTEKHQTVKHFKHDCDDCIFLGHAFEYSKYYDLYAHESSVNRDGAIHTEITLIARYGDDGPDYSSGLAFIDTVGVLAIAFVKYLAGVNLN